MSRGRTHVAGALAAVLLAVAVSGCATSRSYRRGEAFARAGDWDSAVAYYTRAAPGEPRSPRLQDRARAGDAGGVERPSRQGARARSQGRARGRAGRVPQGARVRARQLARDHAARRARAAAAREGRRRRARRRGSTRCASGRGARPKGRSSTRHRRRRSSLNFATNTAIQDILKFIGDVTGINVIIEQGAQSIVTRPTTLNVSGVTLEQGAEPGDDRQSALVQGAERAHHPGHPGHGPEAPAVPGADHPDLLHVARRPAGDLQHGQPGGAHPGHRRSRRSSRSTRPPTPSPCAARRTSSTSSRR